MKRSASPEGESHNTHAIVRPISVNAEANGRQSISYQVVHSDFDSSQAIVDALNASGLEARVDVPASRARASMQDLGDNYGRIFGHTDFRGDRKN